MFWELMFLEMAVPMVLNCLKAESIPSCNHGCNKTTLSYHLHPVKFSVNENRIRCIHRIVTGDSRWIWECLLKSLIMVCGDTSEMSISESIQLNWQFQFSLLLYQYWLSLSLIVRIRKGINGFDIILIVFSHHSSFPPFLSPHSLLFAFLFFYCPFSSSSICSSSYSLQ